MRSDPSDNGGLFVGRRPGTAPVRFRTLPERGSESRQRVDGSLANLLVAAMIFLSLLCWGPIPLACLWVGSQADYLAGSVGLGILVAFVALFALLFGTLVAAQAPGPGLDPRAPRRRPRPAHGRHGPDLRHHRRRSAALVFAFWFVVIHGPGSSHASSGNGSR